MVGRGWRGVLPLFLLLVAAICRAKGETALGSLQLAARAASSEDSALRVAASGGDEDAYLSQVDAELQANGLSSIVPAAEDTSAAPSFLEVASGTSLRGGLSAVPKKCPSMMGLQCTGKGECDPNTGRCQCRKPFRGSYCQFDMGFMRPVWIGCHVQPLPAHVSDVCATALSGDANRCPGYRLLQYKLCNETCPLVEGSNCASANIVKTCADPLIKCPALCQALLGWYCGLSDWDAFLVRTGKPPGSLPRSKTFRPLLTTMGLAVFNSTIVQNMAKQVAANFTAAYYKARKDAGLPSSALGGFSVDTAQIKRTLGEADKMLSQDFSAPGSSKVVLPEDIRPPGPDDPIDWY